MLTKNLRCEWRDCCSHAFFFFVSPELFFSRSFLLPKIHLIVVLLISANISTLIEFSGDEGEESGTNAFHMTVPFSRKT